MRRVCAAIAGLVALFSASLLLAQESNEDQPPDPDTGESTIQERTLGLLPNPWIRQGIKLSATYIGEILGNATGGLKQGAFAQGRGALTTDVDFEKLVGWHGLTAHGNIFAIHVDGLSRSNLQNFFVTSGIEATPTLRLYEAYFEQKFANDKWSIRVGQLAADSEFISTKYTDAFTNASLGWPAIAAINLPSGGPAPPLAAMGARLFATLNEHVAVLAAVFNGDPAGPGVGDPQLRNRYGLDFRVNDPPLVISEVQLSWKSAIGHDRLPGALKLGGWYHFGKFNDEHFDTDGISLASPGSTRAAQALRSDQGIYAVFEQRLYTSQNDDSHGVGVFVRASTSPADRNVVDLYADAGLDFIGVDDRRPNDKFGIALGYARVSKRARQLDADFRALRDPDWPIRSSETLATLSYQYEMHTGWNLLPNIQYIARPSGGATDPLGPLPGRRLREAAVMGVRSVVKF